MTLLIAVAQKKKESSRKKTTGGESAFHKPTDSLEVKIGGGSGGEKKETPSNSNYYDRSSYSAFPSPYSPYTYPPSSYFYPGGYCAPPPPSNLPPGQLHTSRGAASDKDTKGRSADAQAALKYFDKPSGHPPKW